MTYRNSTVLVLLALLLPAAPSVDAQQGQAPRPAPDRRLSLGTAGSQIGVSIRELRPADVAAAKLTSQEGIVIEAVQAGSPAERAGIKSGDIILEFDRERVRGSRHFARLVQETPAGREVQVSVNRAGTRQTLSVTPEEGRWGSLDLEDLRGRIERSLPDLPFGVGQRAVERRLGVTMVPL
jgi:membrane-associated protease RseP (regulator of RpoE activity)